MNKSEQENPAIEAIKELEIEATKLAELIGAGGQSLTLAELLRKTVIGIERMATNIERLKTSLSHGIAANKSLHEANQRLSNERDAAVAAARQTKLATRGNK